MFIPTFVIAESISPIVFAAIFALLDNWATKRAREDPEDIEQRRSDSRFVTNIIIFIVIAVILSFIISASTYVDGVSDICLGVFVGMVTLIIAVFITSMLVGDNLSKKGDKILTIGVVAGVSLFPWLICLVLNIIH